MDRDRRGDLWRGHRRARRPSFHGLAAAGLVVAAVAFVLACYGIGHALAALVLLVIPGTP